MKKTVLSLAVASTLAASAFTSTAAFAELSANAAVTTNYVFRGVTQTDDGFAVQGGIDYGHESGAYAGAWASNVDNGTDSGIEIDGYFGYAGAVEDFGYDVSYTLFTYTEDKFSDDITEIKLGASYGMFSAAYYMGEIDDAASTEYSYIEVGADIPEVLPYDMTINLHYGILDPDVAGADTTNDFLVGVSMPYEGFDISVAYTTEDHTETPAKDGENEFFVTVSKGFEL